MNKKQTAFWDHLDELRGRLLWCFYLFFAGFIGFYFISDHLLDLVRKPLFDALPAAQQKLYYTSLFENFLVHLKLSGYASLFLFSPIYFKILWGFIAPGLYDTEKRHVLPFTIAASVFFLVGASFAYFFLLPVGVKFFLTYGTSAEVPLLTLEKYVTLVLNMLFGFGVCFELPVILVLLAKLGIINAKNLQQHRRTAIIAIAILAAIVAPPDAVSMLLLMGPLYLLYEGAIWAVQRMSKKY